MIEDNVFRLIVFVSVLILMMSLESFFPRRERQQKRQKRWVTNLSLVVINGFVLKLLGPISALLVANYALDNGWGILAYSPVPLPFYVEIILGIILLDLAVYIQHVASHKMPFLWRFHKVHHADRDIDVTTGIRFHPLEAALSMLYKCGLIFLLGPIPVAVMIFEILLNASAMFNHANFRLPNKLDLWLRKVVVTPDFHRVHHSVFVRETDSNYGFFLSIWDRLFKTYIAQPKDGHQNMTIGLASYQTVEPATLPWCLMLPFKKPLKKVAK